MKDVIPYYKKRGETPKEALQRLRKECPVLKDEALSYAGRLDPLAEGLLVVLVGEANKEREKYLGLPKTYQLEVLFGWSTDSYDIAGKLTDAKDARVNPLQLTKALGELEGRREEPYPPYSSKPVNGKPLFEWAREGRLDEIDIPTHMVNIKKIQLLKTRTITGDDLYKYVAKSLGLLTGDFRQDEIWSCWEQNLKGTYNKEYDIAVLDVHCGSGAYMRQLAHELGEHVSVPALALSIQRTEVGEYTISQKYNDTPYSY